VSAEGNYWEYSDRPSSNLLHRYTTRCNAFERGPTVLRFGFLGLSLTNLSRLSEAQ
jgi:hypothetical protein